MARMTSKNSPLRVPSLMPALRPAAEMSWQGNPAASTSTGLTVDQSTVRMSPRFGTPGNRVSRRVLTWGSGSATQATRPPPNAVSVA